MHEPIRDDFNLGDNVVLGGFGWKYTGNVVSKTKEGVKIESGSTSLFVSYDDYEYLVNTTLSSYTTTPDEWDEIIPNTKVGVMIENMWYKVIAIQKEDDVWHCVDFYNRNSNFDLVWKKYDKLLWLNKNPFKSEAQRRYMWANHPGIARRWSHEHKSH